MISDENANIWIRQSWLDNAMRCPERGRFGIVKPELDSSNGDAAALGTGAHAGVEAILLGGSDSDARNAITKAIHQQDAEGIVWKSGYRNIDELITVANACFDAWLDDLYPWVIDNGYNGCQPETEFAEVLYTLDDGRTVGIKGTVDLPTPQNAIIDWKTSRTPYKQWEKQRHAIQPSIYGWAAVRGALGADHYSWPIDFFYGVMVRPSKVGGKASTQIVAVDRTEHHARWAFKQITTFIDLAAKAGLESSWPMVAEGNWLCSAKWCPWYELCRGSILTPADDATV